MPFKCAGVDEITCWIDKNDSSFWEQNAELSIKGEQSIAVEIFTGHHTRWLQLHGFQVSDEKSPDTLIMSAFVQESVFL